MSAIKTPLSTEQLTMEKVEVVFMPSPGIGHIISMVELAKKLDRHRFSVTVLIIPHSAPAFSSAVTAYIETVLTSKFNVRFHYLPSNDPPHNKNHKVETFVTRLIEAYKPQVMDALNSISATVSALIVDCFCTSMVDVGNQLDIPSYIYFTSNAAFLCTMLHLPKLHVTVPCEMRDVEGSLDIPGLPLLPPACMPATMMDKTDEAYTILVDHGRMFSKVKGLIVNSFIELERKQVQAIANGDCLPDRPTPRLYPVGPLIATETARQHRCIEWLDNQPDASVVALCFGSMGSFEGQQVKDMATGLERSGHRFLWALRSPSSGGYRMPTDANLEEVLPEGFLERTKERGLVWPSWVPQVEILAHPAVGGFVTHCGWNSVLESLWYGVPMLGWPLYAEQQLNCLMMVRELGVALEMELDDKNGRLVRSEELEKGVRCLMGDGEEGRKVRAKVAEMKVAGRRAAMDGGSSSVALGELMEEFAKKLP